MKPRLLPVILLLGLPWAASAAEQLPASPGLTSTDPFDALGRALRNEREAKARAGGTTGMGSGREMYETRSFLEGIRQSLSRGEDNNALSAINQIEAMTGSEEVRRACEALADKIGKDRTTRGQAFATEMDVATKRAGEIVLGAKSPKELDGLIADFNRLAESRLSSDGRDTRLRQKIQGTVNFLNRWQEYLAAQAKGDDQAVNNALRNLGENGYNQTLLIPRSEILARLPNNQESPTGHVRRTPAEVNAAVGDILERTRTLDDIPTAITQLNELGARNATGQPSYDNSTELSAALANLQALQKTRAELQAGIATTINLNATRAEGGINPRSSVDSKLAPLRAQMMALALPRLLNAPGEKPAEGEGVSDFLRRLVEAAKKRGDWTTVARGLELSRNLASTPGSYNAANSPDAEGYRQFFAGLNMEAAGQYTQAVFAFLSALRSGAQELPTTAIGEHLATIEKAHPKEFADGNALNPSASPYGPGRVSYPESFPRRNFDPSAISVPAVSPTPPAPAVASSPR